MAKFLFLLVALQLLAGCHADCIRGSTAVRVTLETDKYPAETRWKLHKRNNEWSGPNEDHEKNQKYMEEKCIVDGKYAFTISDTYGDGVCCQNGEGSYKLETKQDGEWKTLFQGGKFQKEEKTNVFIGSAKGRRVLNKMTQREQEYLEAHNVRRMRYHGEWDKPYVPLKWSLKLKERSQAYADISVQECKEGIHAHHGESQEYGENITGNKGTTGGSWARYKSPDGYLTQFVEREDDWEWPRNSHESMAMWRSTQYVGCADASITWINDKLKSQTCHRVVCRYAKPGNCLTSNFDWERGAKADNTRCGPHCPPEGCYTQ